jgi:inorganic pyrophosphatase
MNTTIDGSAYTAFARNGKSLNVIVETPRGCRNKIKFDQQLGAFRLKSVLPVGSAFPYDFGFVPGTRGEDGDPLDVLLLMDEPTFSGCLVRARIVGVIEASQTKNGRSVRNDRVIAVARKAKNYRDLRSLDDVNANLVEEIVHFFKSYNERKHRLFEVIKISGRKRARKLISESASSLGVDD